MNKLNYIVRLFFLLSTVAFFVMCFLIGLLPNKEFLKWVYGAGLFYIGFTVIRTLFYFMGAVKDKIQHVNMVNYIKITELPLISVIMPAYNEEKIIAKSLFQFLHFDYPFLEVIVVDDGSTDQTALIARSFENLASNITVRVLRKPNGGKAQALNYGISHAAGKIIMCVDADSKVIPKSIEASLLHFHNLKVGAVAGFVEVANTNNMLTRFQQLEYLLGLNYIRRAMSVLGVVPVVPGPVGLFRRQALLEVGGFDENRELLAEDAELSMRLIAQGWLIRSEENMISVTEAPEDIMSLLRQRYRWNRGVFQAFRHNATKLLFNLRPRAVFLFAYLLIESFFIPVVNMGAIIMFCTQVFVSAHAETITLWMVSLIFMDIVAINLATYKHGGAFKWLPLLLLGKFSYNFLLLLWRNYSLFEEWLKKRASWDKLNRMGRI